MKKKNVIIIIALMIMYLTAYSQQKAKDTSYFQPIERDINFVKFNSKTKSFLIIDTNQISKIQLISYDLQTDTNRITAKKIFYKDKNIIYKNLCKVVDDTLIIEQNPNIETKGYNLIIHLQKEPKMIIADTSSNAFIIYNQSASSLTVIANKDAKCSFEKKVYIDTLNVYALDSANITFVELYVTKKLYVETKNQAQFAAIKGEMSKKSNATLRSDDKKGHSIYLFGQNYEDIAKSALDKDKNNKNNSTFIKRGVSEMNVRIGIGANFPLKSNSSSKYATNIGFNELFYDEVIINLTNKYSLITGWGIIFDNINMDKNLIVDENNGGRLILYDIPDGVEKFSSKISSVRWEVPIYLRYYMNDKRKNAIELGLMPAYNIASFYNTYQKDNKIFKEEFKNTDLFNKFQLDFHFAFLFNNYSIYMNYGIVPLMNTNKAESFHTFNIGLSCSLFYVTYSK